MIMNSVVKAAGVGVLSSSRKPGTTGELTFTIIRDEHLPKGNATITDQMQNSPCQLLMTEKTVSLYARSSITPITIPCASSSKNQHLAEEAERECFQKTQLWPQGI